MPIKIIAEVAQGHQGDRTLAMLLAKAAVRSGADAVKYQCVFADEAAVPSYKYYDLFRRNELSYAVWEEIRNVVKEAGKEFYLNIGGEKSYKYAKKLNADGVKIHTTNFFNTEIVRMALQTIPSIYVSVGGISPNELEQFIIQYDVKPTDNVCFTYGFQALPTPIEKNHLLKLRALIQRFNGYGFGFEDHTDGDSEDSEFLPLLAIPLGISHIEKHITLDRSLALTDFTSALTPIAFKRFSNRFRRYEAALGFDDLVVTELEHEYRCIVLKVVVTSCDLRAGDVLDAMNTALRRVNDPQPAGFHRKEDVQGRMLAQAVPANTQIIEGLLR